MRRFLAAADVFALTRFSEGIPVVLMEAMAWGVPVVAPRITGIPELVEDGVCGFLTPPGAVDELVGRIGSLLGDADLRNRFAEAGREVVEREFNLKFETGRLVRIVTAHLKGINAMT